MTSGPLTAWLGELDDRGLERLLARRPDVAADPLPRSLDELAQRLGSPYSLADLLRQVPLPQLQLVEALLALGPTCTRDAVAELLEGDGPRHSQRVDESVDALIGQAALYAVGDDIVALDGLADLFPSPLGLGPPLRRLLRDVPADRMRSSLRALGVRVTGRRSDVLAALTTRLTDPEFVRSVVETAPSRVREDLSDLAQTGGEDDDSRWYGSGRYRASTAARTWALERGLLVGYSGYDASMPAEVARALRGPDYHAPFAPEAPAVEIRPFDEQRAARDCASAALSLLDQVTTLLDRVAREPVPMLKTGGVGARELGKLAKTVGCDDATARLAVELAAADGLLALTYERVEVSGDYPAWRELEPAERFASLVATWWTLPSLATQTRDGDGKALRALSGQTTCTTCATTRQALIATLAELTGPAAPGEVAALVAWNHPLTHPIEVAAPSAWSEAELLAVIAGGTVTTIGRALHDGDPDALLAAARSALPSANDRATFGSDLTVYVPGAASARVSRLLDASADREGRGGAATWRFSPASVRRALDSGMTAEDLLTGLAEIATGELPQPLRYLITDVARQHGHLRVHTSSTCVVGADEALATQVAADRRLRKLGLRHIQPTVVVSDAPAEEVLAALRDAGYFPAADTATSFARPGRGTGQAAASARPAQHAAGEHGRSPDGRPRAGEDRLRTALDRIRGDRPDLATARQRLRSIPQGEPPPPSETERTIQRANKRLSVAEARRLAHAIDTRSRVRIGYVAASGGATTRVIDRPELVGGSIYAWCELRDDERVFSVSRIHAVAGA